MINRKGLTKDDFEYIESEAENQELVNRYVEGERNLLRKDAMNDARRLGEKLAWEKTAILMIKEGESNEKISRYTELYQDDIERLRQELKS